MTSFSSLLILPILLFLGFILWQHCQAKSSNFDENHERLINWIMLQGSIPPDHHPYFRKILLDKINKITNSDGNGRKFITSNERRTKVKEKTF